MAGINENENTPTQPQRASQKISAEARAARFAAIEAGLRVSPEEHRARQATAAAVARSALELRQIARSQAQDLLDAAEEDLIHKYEDMSQQIDALHSSFSPPSTPSRSRVLRSDAGTPRSQPAPGHSSVLSVTPGGPAQGHPSVLPVTPGGPAQGHPSILPVTPGGRIVLPSPSPSLVKVKVEESAQSVAEEGYYIVYHGQGGAQGLFCSWDDTEDEQGARGIVQFYAHRLFKKFTDYDQAVMFYEEAKESGFLELLKHEPTSEEMFIVTKGVHPGVYNKRLGLMVDGLAWRGGKVTAASGTPAAAWALFNQWDANGLTARLPRNGPRS